MESIEIAKKIKLYIAIRLAVILLIALVAPEVVNLFFSTPAPYDTLEARYAAGDLLVWISSLLALVGTGLLGSITMYQNHTLNKVNGKLLELENKKDK